MCDRCLSMPLTSRPTCWWCYLYIAVLNLNVLRVPSALESYTNLLVSVCAHMRFESKGWWSCHSCESSALRLFAFPLLWSPYVFVTIAVKSAIQTRPYCSLCSAETGMHRYPSGLAAQSYLRGSTTIVLPCRIPKHLCTHGHDSSHWPGAWLPCTILRKRYRVRVCQHLQTCIWPGGPVANNWCINSEHFHSRGCKPKQDWSCHQCMHLCAYTMAMQAWIVTVRKLLEQLVTILMWMLCVYY